MVVSQAPGGAHLAFTRVRPGEDMPDIDQHAATLLPEPAGAAPQGQQGPTGTPQADGVDESSPGAQANGGPGTGAGPGEQGGRGKGLGGGKGGGALPLLPPRRNRFDPAKALADAHAKGEDISHDGEEANRDSYSLPTNAN